MLTVEFAREEQVPALPVTVYIVLTPVLAITEEPVVLLSPVAGDQLYVLAPLTVKVALFPAQSVALFTESVGELLLVIVTVWVVRQEFASEAVTE